MLLDILRAQGVMGILLFFFLLIIVFNRGFDSNLYKLNLFFEVRSLAIILLFIVLCTHNSGVIFHPLTVYPLIFVQDFLQSTNVSKKNN